MKINIQEREITTSGDFPKKVFGIKSSAQAFEILTSRIYTDVPLAIVRELSTNAFDSHVDAGNADKPFDVHLPNSLEPWFKIRDYGTGLSPEDVERIYSTFFESNRDESDDYVGCMGLGSKAPFAYTDQFTVISYWQGHKYTFSCFKGDGGAPTIAIMNKEDTDEPNGLSIHVPTQGNDYNRFAACAQRVYQYFDVRPNIVGNTIRYDDTEPYLEGDGFTMYRQKPMYLPSQVSVVMGMVCYAVNSREISHRLGYNTGLVINMDIGDCDISASREELQYTDKTNANVQAAIDMAVEAIEKHINDSIAKSGCEYDRLVAKGDFQGILQAGYNKSRLNLRVNDDGEEVLRMHHASVGWKGRLTIDDAWYMHPMADAKFTFIENDVDKLTTKWRKRIRHYIEQNNDAGEVYIVECSDQKVWKEKFGNRKISLTVSGLPEVPREYKGGGSGVPRSFVKRYTGHHRISYAWETPKDIVTENAIVIPKDGNYVIWHGEKVHPKEIAGIARKIGYTVLYGVSEKRVESFCEEHGLDTLEKKTKEYANGLKGSFSEWSIARNNFDNYHRYDFGFNYSELAGLSDECDNLIKLIEADPIDRTDLHIMQLYGIELDTAKNFQRIWLDKYPLMEYVNLRTIPKEFVINYINQIEDK